MLGDAVKIAHGSVSVDTNTHLPTAISAELQVTTPGTMVKQAMGITGFDLTVNATFDSWNEPVHVNPPARATPLKLTSRSLLGLGANPG